MDQRTKKLMTMHKALHHRDDVDKLYMSRKKEEEHPPTSKIASIHRYDDSKTTSKEKRKTNYSDRKQLKNTRIKRTTITRKNGKKRIERIFQAINK